jgi:Tfp pilus assembly protein PilV
MKAMTNIPKRNQLNLTMNGARMTGGMLLEVLLAIAVFAFGMLALVQLQGNLTRSSADAATRTVATNIAEEIVENIRGYKQVQADADNDEMEFLELVGNALTDTITRGGIEYTVTAEINDFWRDDVNDTFIRTDATDPPVAPDDATGGPAYASFKLLKIDVAWAGNQEFYLDDDHTAELGEGKISLYEIIPSSPPVLGAKIAADVNAPVGGPVVEYMPGENPDIAALGFDGEKFKESTTPVPDIIRSGDLTETYFEVVTYNNSNTFLRREEFITVGCECILNTSPADGEGGLRPALWDGIEYAAGEYVRKNFGTSANSQQSVFCDTCCRDHHDGGDVNQAGLEDRALVYDPWAASITPGTDHDHYTRSKKGVISVAGDGDVYLEACRMIRKDGFFVVAQDFNQQGFHGIPENYMDNDVEVAEYAAYVSEAAADFYGPAGQTELKQPGNEGIAARFTNPVDGASIAYIPASANSGTVTNLPTPLGSDSQQLRSRGIYLDYMTTNLSNRIDACTDDDDATYCELPNFTTELEFYPFFEVQLTKLSTWTESPLNMPVDVTSEAIQANNGHSRGRADRHQSGVGPTKGRFAIHEGNVGIAATDPIRLNDPQAAAFIDMNIETVAGDPMGFDGYTISGDILSGVGGVRAADVELSFNEAQCGRTPTGYKCVVASLASSPTLTVSNYFKVNKNLYACSDALSELYSSASSTTFDLPVGANLLTAAIVIEDTPCVAN